MTTADCQSCEWRKGMANKNKGVKIPGEHGKCTRPEGLCEHKQDGLLTGLLSVEPADSALLVAEQGRLDELETIIKDNFLSFYKVGCALKEISEARLYRETHKTFEAYCKELWDVNRRHAYRLIDSAKVVENLCPIGHKRAEMSSDILLIADENKIPANEGQARPLTKLPQEQQIEAWQEAVRTAPEGKITARHVNNVVKSIVGGNVQRKIKKIRKKINKEEHASLEFKRAISEVLTIIQEARSGDWKSTSKEAAVLHLEALIDVVNAG